MRASPPFHTPHNPPSVRGFYSQNVINTRAVAEAAARGRQRSLVPHDKAGAAGGEGGARRPLWVPAEGLAWRGRGGRPQRQRGAGEDAGLARPGQRHLGLLQEGSFRFYCSFCARAAAGLGRFAPHLSPCCMQRCPRWARCCWRRART